MELTQVPKPMARKAFVILIFQCLVASSLAQSMPHSCSFRDPMRFPFSNSGYMPATKIKSLHSTACILSDSMSLLSKFVPYGDRNFKDRCEIKLKIISKKNKSSEHWWPRAFHSCPPCLVISYTQIPRGPSHHKSGSLNNKYHSLNILKQSENYLPMYEPLPSPRQSHSQNNPKTLPGPRPSLLAASTVAPAEISCSTTAAWPFSAAKCSPVSPRAPRMRRGRRGCCGCCRETKRSGVAMGCFSGWLGKYCWIGHR